MTDAPRQKGVRATGRHAATLTHPLQQVPLLLQEGAVVTCEAAHPVSRCLLAARLALPTAAVPCTIPAHSTWDEGPVLRPGVGPQEVRQSRSQPGGILSAMAIAHGLRRGAWLAPWPHAGSQDPPGQPQ